MAFTQYTIADRTTKNYVKHSRNPVTIEILMPPIFVVLYVQTLKHGCLKRVSFIRGLFP
jgi:hypothetical protein